MTRIRPFARLAPWTSLPLLSIGILAGSLSHSAQAGTWTVQKDNIATVLMGVDFLNQNSGYLAGANDGTGQCILHTIDGGRTFNNQISNLQTAMYLDVSFGDAQHSVAGGLGMFYRFAGASYTTDGTNWHPSQDRWLASAYQDVDAVDAEHMYMIGLWSRASSYGSGVAASTDGGRSFTYYDWGVDTDARYGSFVDANVGYISGGQWASETVAAFGKGGFRAGAHVKVPGRTFKHDISQRTAYDGYRGTIAKTVNGGESWVVVYDDYDRFYFNGIQFVDEDNGWAVAEGEAGAWILHTDDGGVSWDEQFYKDGASLMNIRMIDANEGWAVGAMIGLSYKALLLHTTDGGKTWSEVTTNLGKYYIFALDFVDADHGWAVGLSPAGAGSLLQYAP